MVALALTNWTNHYPNVSVADYKTAACPSYLNGNVPTHVGHSLKEEMDKGHTLAPESDEGMTCPSPEKVTLPSKKIVDGHAEGHLEKRADWLGDASPSTHDNLTRLAVPKNG